MLVACRAILLQRLVMSGVTYAGEDQEDAYEHVAPILTNVSRLKEARVLLMQPGRGTLQALVAQLQAPSAVRRQGVAATIRNCCMSAEVGDRAMCQFPDARVSRTTSQHNLYPKPI